MIATVAERLRAERALEDATLERVCWHEFHSIRGYPVRWVCHLCGVGATRCRYDYYVNGRRNTPIGVEDIEDRMINILDILAMDDLIGPCDR